MSATKKAGTVVKKKVWIPVRAPDFMGNVVLCETTVSDPQAAIGKHVFASMIIVTNDPGHQALNADYKIVGVKEGACTTEILGLEWLPAALRKLMRKSREKLDDSFVAVTDDGKKVRLKLLMITRNRATRGITSEVRRQARKSAGIFLANQTYHDAIMSIVQRKLQKAIQEGVKKTYPLAVCEARQFHLLGEATPAELAAAKALAKQPVVEKAADVEEEDQTAMVEPAGAPVVEQAPEAEQSVVAE